MRIRCRRKTVHVRYLISWWGSCLQYWTVMTQLRRCYNFNNSKLTESILTFYELPQPMSQPVWSWWMRPARHSAMPVEAHWGQQSKCSTLRTPRHANLTWTAVIISLKVTGIQHEVRPHQHHLQQLEWEITQLLQKNITTSIWNFKQILFNKANSTKYVWKCAVTHTCRYQAEVLALAEPLSYGYIFNPTHLTEFE